MNRYIDADEVEKLLKVGCAYAIWELPSIDIIRCKRCVKRMTDDCPMCNECNYDKVPTKDDDFCSYGESEGE